MIVISALLFFIATAFVSAFPLEDNHNVPSPVDRSSSSRSHKGRLCARELEGVVHQPTNCAYDYLKRISAQLRCQSPLLFTASNASVIESFESTYDVTVSVLDAFGNPSEFIYSTPPIDAADALSRVDPALRAQAAAYVAAGFALSKYDNVVAKTRLIGEGFGSVDSPPGFLYGFNIYNPAGVLYTILVQADKTSRFFACKK